MKEESSWSTAQAHSEETLSEPLLERKPYSEAEMLATIAQTRHLVQEVAQPLTAILTLIELIANNEHLDDSSFEDIHTMLDEAHLLKDIVRELQNVLAEDK